VIGYDHAAKIAHEAQEKGQTLREAASHPGFSARGSWTRFWIGKDGYKV
jgi:fumarate hydratase class II